MKMNELVATCERWEAFQIIRVTLIYMIEELLSRLGILN